MNSQKIINKLLDKFNIKVKDDKYHLVVQIFNFIIVGFIATAIDFIFLYIFKDICNIHLIIANSLSFIISVIYNYFASIIFVFDVNTKNNNTKLFVLFVLFSIIGLGLNNIILWFVSNFFKVYYLLSKIIATVFVMIFNFVTRKKFME